MIRIQSRKTQKSGLWTVDIGFDSLNRDVGHGHGHGYVWLTCLKQPMDRLVFLKDPLLYYGWDPGMFFFLCVIKFGEPVDPVYNII